MLLASRTLCVCLLLAGACAPAAAKRPLSHRDYDGWRSIQNPALSRDGRWVAYGLFPQDGDGQIVVREIATGKEYRHDAGALPAPPLRVVDEPSGGSGRPHGVRLVFTRDGRYLIGQTFPGKAEAEKARKEKKKPEEMPKPGLVIVDLATGAGTRIAGVATFQAPENGGDWLAWHKQPKPAEPAKGEEAKSSQPRAAASGTGARRTASDLVLRDLAAGSERTFADVLDYTLSRDGKLLLYTVSSKNQEENGLYSLAVGGNGAPAALLKGKGKYGKLTWNREQTRLAFLSDRDDSAAKQPRQRLYLWERNAAAPVEIVSGATAGFQKDYAISESGAMFFARDGSRVFFACGRPAPERPRSAGGVADRVVADLWHWKDDLVQPMQRARASRERGRGYAAVFHLDDKKFVQLADGMMRTIVPSDSGRYAMGADDHAYRRMIDYDGAYADEMLVDTLTGARTRVLERFRAGWSGQVFQWSPDGRYVLFYRDRDWHTLSVPEGRVTNLTAGLGVRFFNTDDDRPEPPSSFGTAGWTSDSRSVVVYDRYDAWQISPDGRSTRNLTEGYGRRNRLQFRAVRLESEDEQERRGLDPEKPLLLRAEDLETRDTGFFRDRLGVSTPPEKLLMDARNFRTVAKAKDADVILVTASTFNEFPDLHAANSEFRHLRRLSDANPQKSDLTWGTGELVRYKNADGVPLKAALFRPEDFDPAKKYPMLVYIYERLSQNLHNFADPRPGASISPSYYVSNGYLVLMPDIVYTVGAPGQSALKCVLPAIQAVVDRGYVNENAIGIQGHSWGGYQVAYLVGHTTRFRAAEAGAPVADMISAYNGIRWGSGMPRQFQYEKSQSRIGGSIWQNPMQFIENSPVFSAERVRTPLLILHDDQDDAVPWYQGIELFLSLRRLGKEAYLFNYNGELHGLRRRPDQKDYAVRMQQFFDHFLKGAPRPAWMENGIPYEERDREKDEFRMAAYGK